MNAFFRSHEARKFRSCSQEPPNITIFDNPVVSATGLDSPIYAWGVDRSDQLTGTNNEYQFERDREQ
jgi:hypothetical protein